MTTSFGYSTAVGYRTLSGATTAYGNTAMGYDALKAIVTTNNNTALGRGAGSTSTGSNSVMIGFDAGKKGGTGTTAVGYDALGSSSLGASYLTAVGSAALKNNTTGANNAAFGTDALLDNTTGAGNTGVGMNAGIKISTGSNNTFLGYQAGKLSTTGDSNTYIGNLAGNTTTTGDNNTLLGYDAEASSATVSNEITLGNTAVTKFRIPALDYVIDDGVVGIGTTAPYTTTKLNVTGATSTSTTAYNATNPPAAGQLDIRSTDAYGTQLGGKLTFSGISGADGNASAKSVYGSMQGYKTNTTINNSGGGLFFSTTVNATGVLTERMRLTGDGYVLVNTTTQVNLGQYSASFPGTSKRGAVYNNTESFDGSNYVSFSDQGTVVGTIVQNGASSVSYTTTSDYRLKENVIYDWDATTRMKQLKPARFNFITDDATVDGFLAHEAATVVPEAIIGTKDQVEVWTSNAVDDGEAPDGVSAGDNKLDDDGNTIPVMQGIDQSKLVPLLVKTILELEARITALEG